MKIERGPKLFLGIVLILAVLNINTLAFSACGNYAIGSFQTTNSLCTGCITLYDYKRLTHYDNIGDQEAFGEMISSRRCLIVDQDKTVEVLGVSISENWVRVRPKGQIRELYISCKYISAPQPSTPGQTAWDNLVNNAFRTADKYAVKRNPNCAFTGCVGNNREARLVYQAEGEYKGTKLLMITCKNNKGICFAVLKPNFDLLSPLESIDASSPAIWTVVLAKYNGREF